MFASWSPPTGLGKLEEDQTLSSPTPGKIPDETVQLKQPPPLDVELSPIQRALRQLGADWTRQEQFGYLFRQLKGECYYFRLLFIFTSFGFASSSVLPTSPTLRLFLTGLFFLADQLIVLLFQPFELPTRNLVSAGLSWVGVIQCMVMLALVQLGLSDGTSTQLSLGHSTESQVDTAQPSDALTGVSYVAAYYELVLGMIWLSSTVVVAVVHRRHIYRGARIAAGALQEWFHPHGQPRLSESGSHRRLQSTSNSWQADCSKTPRSPVSVELTQQRRPVVMTDGRSSSSSSRRLDDVPETIAADVIAPRPVHGAGARPRLVVRSESRSHSDADRETPTAQSEEENIPAVDDEADDSLGSTPGLLSSLTTPLAAPSLSAAVPILTNAPDWSANRPSLPAAPRNLPPVRVQRVSANPAMSTTTTQPTATLSTAGLPGTVETPAGSRRVSQCEPPSW